MNKKTISLIAVIIVIALGILYFLRNGGVELAVYSQATMAEGITKAELQNFPVMIPENIPLVKSQASPKGRGNLPPVITEYAVFPDNPEIGQPIYAWVSAYDPECQNLTVTLNGTNIEGELKGKCKVLLYVSGMANTIGKDTIKVTVKDASKKKTQASETIFVRQGYGY